VIGAGKGARYVRSTPRVRDYDANVSVGGNDKIETGVRPGRGVEPHVLCRPRACGVHGVGRDPRGAGVGRLRNHFRQRAVCDVLDVRILGCAMARMEDEHDAHGTRADVMLGRVVRDRARDLVANDAARCDDHLGVVLRRVSRCERHQTHNADQQCCRNACHGRSSGPTAKEASHETSIRRTGKRSQGL